MKLLNLAMLWLCFGTSSIAHANFDWGGDCDQGDGRFDQSIEEDALIEVGVIPAGKRQVTITLRSDEDIDVQLYDEKTGEALVAWPDGRLNGASEATLSYGGLEIVYSGYNGLDGELGHESITLRGTTDRAFVMKAFGYQSGSATVTYSFKASTTCWEKGAGSFVKQVEEDAFAMVGTIDSGLLNVYIELDSYYGRDIDIQLIDAESGNEIVAWPNGLLQGASEEEVIYESMTIRYSGYNGTAGDWGREWIEVQGFTSKSLQLKVFGYQSGHARVTYRFGEGTGDDCIASLDTSCSDGLMCKTYTEDDVASSQCHQPIWCYSEENAASDCASQGEDQRWGCEAHRCVSRGPRVERGNAQEEESCTSDLSCIEGLRCSGLTIYDGEGYCRAESTFFNVDYNSEQDEALYQPIPDAATSSEPALIMEYNVETLATVPEDVVISLVIDHPRPEDLRIVFYGAARTWEECDWDECEWDQREVIWDRQASDTPGRIVLNDRNIWAIERDNMANGRYVLRIIDEVAGNGPGEAFQPGYLVSYSLSISSRYD